MQEIIVASDLSDRSRPALKRAVELAIATGAKLTVLNVVNDSIPSDLSHQLSVGAHTILSEQVAAAADGRPLDADVRVVVGDPISKINDAVVDAKADLLIVGLHRRRKFLDQIRETTMEHLIRASDIPVLLVTRQCDRAYEQVLFGVALSSACAAALHKVALVAQKSELTLFHAHEVSFRKEAERDYHTWKTIHPVLSGMPEPIFVESSANEALEGLMATHSYDLLVVGGHTRSEGGGYFLGRFTASLIRKPPCDLLIAK